MTLFCLEKKNILLCTVKPAKIVI